MMSNLLRFENSSEAAALKYRAELPKFFITPEALGTMAVYVEETDTEVGWLGRVKRLDSEEEAYLCDKVYLLRQKVHGATTEITPEGLFEFASELEKSNSIEDLEHILLWGHSHVKMSTSASGQDDDQIKLFEENNSPVFFRVIANKLGSFDVTFYDFKKDLEVQHLPWEIYSPYVIDTAAIKQELKDKVAEKPINVGGMGWERTENGGWIQRWGEKKEESKSSNSLVGALNNAGYYDEDFNYVDVPESETLMRQDVTEMGTIELNDMNAMLRDYDIFELSLDNLSLDEFSDIGFIADSFALKTSALMRYLREVHKVSKTSKNKNKNKHNKRGKH